MPIDEKRKYVYIHIPKTGGTAIEECLGLKSQTNNMFWGPRSDVDASKQHYSYSEMLSVRSDIKNWFVFASVRNPWDRVLSGWSHHPKWKSEVGSFQNFIDMMVKHVFLEKNMFWLDGYVTPQTHFLPNDNECHLLKFENLQLDFTSMCKERAEFEGIKSEMPKLDGRLASTGIGKNYWDYYNEKQMKLVAELFAKEIESFGYQFEVK